METLTQTLSLGSKIVEYTKGQTIYNYEKPTENIYLIITGRVCVSRLADNGKIVMMDIYHDNEFFGELTFLRLTSDAEQATALGPVELMAIAISQIETVVKQTPRLELVMLQIMLQRSESFQRRIQSLVTEKIPRRTARALLHFADRLGETRRDGSICIPWMSHQMLSEFVGTSREMVSSCMSKFRRQGLVCYRSNRDITVHYDDLRNWLNQNS